MMRKATQSPVAQATIGIRHTPSVQPRHCNMAMCALLSAADISVPVLEKINLLVRSHVKCTNHFIHIFCFASDYKGYKHIGLHLKNVKQVVMERPYHIYIPSNVSRRDIERASESLKLGIASRKVC
jgi:hypothetical protein